jgi:tetratricopeptide (TPR) repeat protein
MLAVRLLFRLVRSGRAWWRGRSLRLLLAGLPALLAGAGAAVLTGLSLLTPAGELEARYLEAGKSALKRQDYAAALTCYDRLAPRGGDRPEALYGLALTAEALGQPGRAAALMADLAPADQTGYGPAHVWQARHLLQTPGDAAETLAAAKNHLQLALKCDLEDRDAAHGLLGELCLAEFQLDRTKTPLLDEAETHLTRAARTRPQLRMRLAQLYTFRGQKERAVSEATQAANYFRSRISDSADHFARVHLADALAFLEKFPEAVSTLEEGWNATHEPVYRTALARVYTVWSDVLLAQDAKANVGKRLELMQRGLDCDPANQGLLNRLLVAIQTNGPDAEDARKALQNMAATGQAPAMAMAHFALGLDAWQHGRAPEAQVHWERAFDLTPQVPAIANNLAWLLAEAKPPDLPRALELANRALERAPNNPGFRDTRGRILARLGRWKEALPDLEAAVAAAPADPALHGVLADVYRHLGVAGMAEEHERLAQTKSPEKAKPH